MFYNVENLFDPFHDSLKNDYDFVGGGVMGWNWDKFTKKLRNISKVVITAGGWQPPEIICFSEVENRFVLIQLLKRTPLERFDYRIIHEESPDDRGIDVAMIYRADRFREISHQKIKVNLPDSAAKTRDILYVKGVIKGYTLPYGNDTLHLFINHWPSRSGGVQLTKHRRQAAALSLKPIVDSILRNVDKPQVILMGDFNDEPIDESINTVIGANNTLGDSTTRLYNLMFPFVGKKDTGTNKFKSQWGVIDQFIVNGALLKEDAPVYVSGRTARILNFPFLLKVDEAWTGTVPFRTFNGRKYQGGFSDHLPIMLDLRFVI